MTTDTSVVPAITEVRARLTQAMTRVRYSANGQQVPDKIVLDTEAYMAIYWAAWHAERALGNLVEGEVEEECMMCAANSEHHWALCRKGLGQGENSRAIAS